MTSEVSSEKPKAVMAAVAASIRRGRQGGGACWPSAGPPWSTRERRRPWPAGARRVGAAPLRRQRVRHPRHRVQRHGHVARRLPGRGGACPSTVTPTISGSSTRSDVSVIAAAVEAGWLRGGVLYECVRAGVPFVLGGSVRDDGPLPDVITDTVAAADAMRAQLDERRRGR